MQLSVVIATWNRSALLAGCLESLEATQAERPQVVVVDNASTDGTVAMVAERFPWVEVVRLPENGGFARANNAGVATASGDRVLLLDGDTRLLEDFAPLVALFADAHVGAAGPRLVGADGGAQLSARLAFPTAGRVLRDYRRPGRSAPEPSAATAVGWVAGAALFVRASAYRATGGLDEC